MPHCTDSIFTSISVKWVKPPLKTLLPMSTIMFRIWLKDDLRPKIGMEKCSVRSVTGSSATGPLMNGDVIPHCEAKLIISSHVWLGNLYLVEQLRLLNSIFKTKDQPAPVRHHMFRSLSFPIGPELPVG